MAYPDDYTYVPDDDLWEEARNTFGTSRHKTVYTMVTRDLDTNKVEEDGKTHNIATASLWLRYNNKPTYPNLGKPVPRTTREVYEISMGGVRQLGQL